MLLKRVRIDAANLECGMYVAQLDRPWLETPFLFQGFEIRDEKDLKQLRHFCKHVYVDATRGSVPSSRVLEARRTDDVAEKALVAGKIRTAPRRPASLQRRLFDAISQLDRSGRLAAFFQQKHYRNIVPTHLEAPKAIQAYDEASATLTASLDRFLDGKGLDATALREAVTPVIDSILRNQDAMVWLVSLRKREVAEQQRSIGSAVWAAILGRHLGFERTGLETLALGGMLLDLGNSRIPRTIILKEGPLDEIERAIMQKHVKVGLDLVRATPGLNSDVIAMIEHHHERHDGSGYAKGLKGSDIPVFGRIAGLIDCFDAMTTKRPYAPARSAYDAVREINRLSGTSFQSELVEQFVQAVGMFPTGSLVELNTGEVAIVTEQNRVRRLRPKLLVLLDGDKAPMSRNPTLDLRDRVAGADDDSCFILRGLEPGAFGLDPKNFFG